MVGFVIAPVNAQQATDTGFPDYLQFQAAGSNLGARDADTLNFGSGLTATRGVGENENTVTVDATGGTGGGSPALAVQLTGNAPASMNAAVFSDWTGVTVAASTDASWSQADQAIKFITAGVYRIEISGRAHRNDNGAWPVSETFVGSAIDEDVNIPKTQYARDDGNIGAGQTFMAWSDTFIVTVAANQLIQPKVYADSYLSSGTQADFLGRVIVQRLGDAA